MFIRRPCGLTLPSLLLAAGLNILLAGPAGAQTVWPPVDPEDLAMKDCPQQPGAAAVILYREEITDGETFATSVFRRLKVLTDAGREYSNIEIYFISGVTKVTGIQARVVPPQGPAREFGGQIFDKTAVRYRKTRVAAKTLALPDVAVGSIIDYRYKIEIDYGGSGSTKGLEDVVTGLGGSGGRPEEGGYAEMTELRALPFESWDVQEELFTKRAKFVTTTELDWIPVLFGRSGCKMSWVSIGKMSSKPTIEKGRVALELVDIPPFEEEEYSVPEETLRISVDLFYVNGKVVDNNEFWKLESEDWQRGVEAFLGKPGKHSAAAREVVGDASDPMERLRRIYAKVQGLRNLSYEKGLTRRQRKEQKIKDNRKVSDVLERGFGLRSDITRTFVALARDAGFEAGVVTGRGPGQQDLPQQLPLLLRSVRLRGGHGQGRRQGPGLRSGDPLLPLRARPLEPDELGRPPLLRHSAGLFPDTALPARHGPDPARDRADARPPGQPRRHRQDDLHGPGGPGPAARAHS